MDSTQVFMLDKLIKAMPMDTLNEVREKLEKELTEAAIEIADMVGQDEKFGLESLIGERETLKIYISRIDAQLNVLITRSQTIMP